MPPAQQTEMPAFYRICQSIVRAYFDILHDFSISGLHNIPRNGPFILAANHVSFYDPPALGARIPRALHYFARDTLFRPPLGRILEGLEVIPVARDHADLKSVRAVLRALDRGGGVVIYPEGTRSETGAPLPPKPGAGMIACRSGATVVPARLFGTFEAFGRHRTLPRIGGGIHVCYGPPIDLASIDPGKQDPDRYRTTSHRIMEAILKLRPPAPEPV